MDKLTAKIGGVGTPAKVAIIAGIAAVVITIIIVIVVLASKTKKNNNNNNNNNAPPEPQYVIEWALGGPPEGTVFGVGPDLKIQETLQAFYVRDNKLVSVDDETLAVGHGAAYGTVGSYLTWVPVSAAIVWSDLPLNGTGDLLLENSDRVLSKSGGNIPDTFDGTAPAMSRAFVASAVEWNMPQIN